MGIAKPGRSAQWKTFGGTDGGVRNARTVVSGAEGVASVRYSWVFQVRLEGLLIKNLLLPDVC